jgi:hypothetical protein
MVVSKSPSEMYLNNRWWKTFENIKGILRSKSKTRLYNDQMKKDKSEKNVMVDKEQQTTKDLPTEQLHFK